MAAIEAEAKTANMFLKTRTEERRLNNSAIARIPPSFLCLASACRNQIKKGVRCLHMTDMSIWLHNLEAFGGGGSRSACVGAMQYLTSQGQYFDPSQPLPGPTPTATLVLALVAADTVSWASAPRLARCGHDQLRGATLTSFVNVHAVVSRCSPRGMPAQASRVPTGIFFTSVQTTTRCGAMRLSGNDSA